MATTSTLRKSIWAIVALCAVILALIAYGQWTGQGVKQNLGIFGVPFKLASTKGGELDSQTLNGRPYGIFFGFAHCPELCPTTLFEMSASLKELGDSAKDFRLLFITVDPERDTLPVIKDYLSNFDPRIEGLVPTVEQLPKLARDFHIYYKKEPTSDGSYTMDHTATLFLMDKSGQLKSTISFDENRATRTTKLKNLMTGG